MKIESDDQPVITDEMGEMMIRTKYDDGAVSPGFYPALAQIRDSAEFDFKHRQKRRNEEDEAWAQHTGTASGIVRVRGRSFRRGSVR